MTFYVDNNPSPSEIASAINYLLANFAQTTAINPNSGQITSIGYGVVSYLYKYLNVKYADSFDGTLNFSNSPTGRIYYGLRNNDSAIESTNPVDYVWTEVVGGFGTTKNIYYATTGGRQIQYIVATAKPSAIWLPDTGAAIDLDFITYSNFDELTALAPRAELGTMSPQNAEKVNITGGLISGLSSPLEIASGGTNATTTPTAGAVAYGTGTAYGFTAAGTAGQVLTSAGAGVPTWTTNAGGDVTGPASSTDNAVARFDGTTGKLIQNSVTTIDDTGNASGILSQQFSNGSAVTLAAGKFWYDGSTGAWNMGMGNGNITQQVGEELFIYGKASAAITDSPLQIVYHTGTVGASGTVKFAPTVSGITDVNAILGIATENIALNGFGRITTYGVVHGITTNGTAFGETWADDDVIWYNPVTGNPTKVEPVAPNIKVQVGLVINAGSGGSGSFQVGIARGSKLGGTDSNVQIGTPSNGQILTYDGSATYWKNTTLTAGTGVSISPSAGGVLTISATGSGGTVTSVTGTSPVVSSGGTTPAISLATAYGDTLNPYAAKTANYVLAGPTTGAATVPAFRALVAADIPTAALSKTNDTNVTLTLGGSPTTALVNAASLTLGWTGQLGISRGGTNTSTAPSAYGVVYGNSGGTAYTSLANGTTGQILTATTSGAPSWAAPAYTGTVTSVSFTGGIISVATASTTPALTIAGTSGGIPYFASGTTWASSAALTQYGVVYGGGAGATPVATAAGTTGQILTATTGAAPTWAAPATNGTVTTVSVVSANGFAGTVATATTTPTITLTTSITGVLKGNGTAISAAVVNTDYFAPSAPVTKTADFTVAATDVWLINNKTGSTCTATLPAASSWSGRVLRFLNYQVQTLVSASANVVPLTGGAAATSILLASSGDSATLVSDGTNWLMTQYIPNNILLLE